MTYSDMPVIIPLLATGYLLTIYLLLILAQRTTKKKSGVPSRNAALPFPSLQETLTFPLETATGYGNRPLGYKPPEGNRSEGVQSTRSQSPNIGVLE